MRKLLVAAAALVAVAALPSGDAAAQPQRQWGTVSNGNCICKRSPERARVPANVIAQGKGAINAYCERTFPNGCVKGSIRQR